MNTERSDVDERRVESGANAAEDELAELDVGQRHEAAERREAVVHGVDGAARGVGRDRRPECRMPTRRSALPCPPCCRAAARSADRS